jgi:hypothetical protein
MANDGCNCPDSQVGKLGAQCGMLLMVQKDPARELRANETLDAFSDGQVCQWNSTEILKLMFANYTPMYFAHVTTLCEDSASLAKCRVMPRNGPFVCSYLVPSQCKTNNNFLLLLLLLLIFMLLAALRVLGMLSKKDDKRLQRKLARGV